MESDTLPVAITVRHGNSIYYWNEDDKMMWKQILPARAMHQVIRVIDPKDINTYIFKDINGELV